MSRRPAAAGSAREPDPEVDPTVCGGRQGQGGRTGLHLPNRSVAGLNVGQMHPHWAF